MQHMDGRQSKSEAIKQAVNSLKSTLCKGLNHDDCRHFGSFRAGFWNLYESAFRLD
nr:MAG TPA: hypothetical protein [Caudoviricetes sp.]